jgi:cellulose synthase/poly-beta-1,6-N-acetylglucosamine synthase-like glycosyltransferase
VQISVVIPAYNAARSLPALLAEVRRQCGPATEVIVIDDGSQDDTSAAAAGPLVRCVRQDNAGPAAARNRGAALATGDILLFLDSDLVPAEDFIAQMTSPFADPTIDAVQGTMRTRQRELVPRYCQAEIEYKQLRCVRQRFIDSIAAGIFAIRRAVYWQYGGFCTQFRMAAAEDTDLSFRLAADGRRILFNPQALAEHPQPASLRSYVRLKFWRGYWRALLYRRHPTKVVRDSYTSQMQKIQVSGAALAPVWLPLAWLLGGWIAVLAGVALITLTTVPATLGVARLGGLGPALITPGMQFVASWSLGIGLVCGTLRRLPTQSAAGAPPADSSRPSEENAC